MEGVDMADGVLRYLGESRDGRTNRWSVEPPCGHGAFEPRTTRFAKEIVECPKCGLEIFVGYNARTVTD